MVEKLKKLTIEPPVWYKTLLLTSIPVFLTFILSVLWSMQGSIGGMEESNKAQEKAFTEFKIVVEKYVDKNDARMIQHEKHLDILEKDIIRHDFEIKALQKKVK